LIDYESIRELSVFCKKQGITLNALTSCIRLNNYIQTLGANVNESTLESLIANLANYPDRDPAKLVEAAAQISESGIPLEKLEEHVKALIAEKEMPRGSAAYKVIEEIRDFSQLGGLKKE